MKHDTRKLIPVAEAARMLGIHRKTYDRWLEEGRDIPEPIVIGDNELRVVLEELEAWIAKQPRRSDRTPARGGKEASKSAEIEVSPPTSET